MWLLIRAVQGCWYREQRRRCGPSPFSHWSQHWHVFEAPWFSLQYGPPSAYLICTLCRYMQRYKDMNFQTFFGDQSLAACCFFYQVDVLPRDVSPARLAAAEAKRLARGPTWRGETMGCCELFWGNFFCQIFFWVDPFWGGIKQYRKGIVWVADSSWPLKSIMKIIWSCGFIFSFYSGGRRSRTNPCGWES